MWSRNARIALNCKFAVEVAHWSFKIKNTFAAKQHNLSKATTDFLLSKRLHNMSFEENGRNAETSASSF
jgi:hypothetical protein